jgi:hypothetical protein
VSARDALMRALWDNYTLAEKNAFVDAFAHELAEQQRAWASEPLTDAGAPEYGSVENVLVAADRIDPLKDKP